MAGTLDKGTLDKAAPIQTGDLDDDIVTDAKVATHTTTKITTTDKTLLNTDIVYTDEITFKTAVRIATEVDDTLSGLAARDGITPVAGNRVLVKAQTSGQDNGIYDAASGAWTRSTDYDNDAKTTSGSLVLIQEGTENADKSFQLTTNEPITLGTTPLVYAEFGGASPQTPWTSDIDAAGFDLLNFGFLEDNSANPASVGVIRLGISEEIRWRNAANDNDLSITFDAADRFTIANSGTPEYQLSSTEADWLGNNIINVGFLEDNTANPATVGTIRLGNTKEIAWRNAANTVDLLLRVDANNVFEFINGPIRLNSQQILEVGSLTQSGVEASTGFIRMVNTSGIFWRNAGDDNNVSLTVDGSNIFIFSINGTTEMTMAPTELNLQGNNLRMGGVAGGIFFDDNSHNILQAQGDIRYNSAVSQGHRFHVDGSLEMRLTATTLDLQTNNLTLGAGSNIILATSTGTQIGTGTTQLLAFYGTTPVVQPTVLTSEDATAIDGTYDSVEQAVLNNVRTRLGEVETKLQALGLLA